MYRQDPRKSVGPSFCSLSAATAAAVVAIVTAVVAATAGQNKDQDDDPPAAVSSEKAVVVAHNQGSSFRCQTQMQRRTLCCVFLCSVLSTIHHIAKELFWLQFLFLKCLQCKIKLFSVQILVQIKNVTKFCIYRLKVTML